MERILHPIEYSVMSEKEFYGDSSVQDSTVTQRWDGRSMIHIRSQCDSKQCIELQNSGQYVCVANIPCAQWLLLLPVHLSRSTDALFAQGQEGSPSTCVGSGFYIEIKWCRSNLEVKSILRISRRTIKNKPEYFESHNTDFTLTHAGTPSPKSEFVDAYQFIL